MTLPSVSIDGLCGHSPRCEMTHSSIRFILDLSGYSKRLRLLDSEGSVGRIRFHTSFTIYPDTYLKFTPYATSKLSTSLVSIQWKLHTWTLPVNDNQPVVSIPFTIHVK